MYCKYCGKQTDNDSNICNECEKEHINEDKKVKKRVLKLKIFIPVLILVIIGVIVGVYYGMNYIEVQENIKTIPSSKYVTNNNMIFRGNIDNFYAWATIVHHSDGSLAKITDSDNLNYLQNVVGYRVLIENKSNNELTVDSSKLALILNNNNSINPFDGESDGLDDGYQMENPYIIELNGKDISLQQKTSVTLAKNDYCVIYDYFIINAEDENSALNDSKEIKYDLSSSNIDKSLEVKKLK